MLITGGAVGTVMVEGQRVEGRLGDLLSRWRSRKALPWVGKRVLDLGCGKGTILRYLEPGVRYTGVDRDAQNILMLRELYPQHEFYVADLDGGLPPLRPGYDTVLLLAVIEHLRDPQTLLLRCNGLLRAGARVVITVPTRWGEMVHRLMGKLGLVNPEAKTAHLNVLDRTSLRRLVKEVGGVPREHRRFQLGCNRLFVYEKPVAEGFDVVELDSPG